MYVWELCINHAHGDSFEYYFEESPRLDYLRDREIVRYEGEGLNIFYRNNGFGREPEVVRIENKGLLTVCITPANVINWYVQREEITPPEEKEESE